MEEPLISIGVPTYNRANYLNKSIKSCLNQTYDNIEILVYDNASTDNTKEIIASFQDSRVKYFRHNNLINPIDNWNSCFKTSTGYYFTYISDDDLLKPRYIEKLFELSQSYPNASLYRCGFNTIDENDKIIGEYSDYNEFDSPENFFKSRIIGSKPQFLPGFLFKTNDIRKIGGFRDVGFPGALYTDDYLWFNLSLCGNGVVSTKKILWCYRKHLMHMGAFINIDDFFNNIPMYTQLLSEFCIKNQFSQDLITFIQTKYANELITVRLNLEMDRYAKYSKMKFFTKLPKFYFYIKEYKCNINYLNVIMKLFS